MLYFRIWVPFNSQSWPGSFQSQFRSASFNPVSKARESHEPVTARKGLEQAM